MKNYSNKQLGTYLLPIALGLASSITFWLHWQKLLTNPLRLFTSLEGDLTTIAIAAASGVILFAAISLVALLLPKRIDLLVYGLIFAPLFILNQPNWVLALSLFVLWLPAVLFTWQIKREVQNHIEFSTFHIFSARLPLLVTALSIVLGLQFFAASQEDARAFEFKIPESIFDQAVKIVQPMVSEQIDQQVPDIPGDAVQGARTQVNQQLARLPGLEQLPPEVQESLMRGEIPPELEEQLRAQGISDEQVANFESQLQQDGLATFLPGELKNELETQINRIIEPYRQYLPVILGLVVFFVIRTFGGLINLVAMSLTSALIALLLQAGLVKKKFKSVRAERLVIE